MSDGDDLFRLHSGPEYGRCHTCGRGLHRGPLLMAYSFEAELAIGLPGSWLGSEASAGRLPATMVDDVPYLDVDLVLDELRHRAAEESQKLWQATREAK